MAPSHPRVFLVSPPPPPPPTPPLLYLITHFLPPLAFLPSPISSTSPPFHQDGHASHRSREMIDAANERKICILTFPPHSTDKMQPLDVAVFGPLKQKYT